MPRDDFGTTRVWPFLTPDLPGVGGRIKHSPEDFFVEEMPLYPPCGRGTHTYVYIEKRGLSTLQAVAQIARALGKRPHEIGYAGLKDADAVTRQMLSVEHAEPQRVTSLQLGSIRVLFVSRHTNKLKLGHLRGNRFVIKLRGVEPVAMSEVRAIVETLTHRGVPNYFGSQRFGTRGNNHWIGRAVLAGDLEEALAIMLGRPGAADHGDVREARSLFDAGEYARAADAWPGGFRQEIKICRALAKSHGDIRRGWAAVDGTLRRLYPSAFQAYLFNRVLAERIGGIDRLLDGDVAWKHSNGACFSVSSAAVEQPRCAAFEISPTGPIFGYRMTEAADRPGDVEARLLADAGLDRTHFRNVKGMKLTGARRPLRVPLQAPSVDQGQDDAGPFVRLAFALPPGAYATSVTREVCKNDLPSSNV